jgi:hypothetical protein
VKEGRIFGCEANGVHVLCVRERADSIFDCGRQRRNAKRHHNERQQQQPNE